MVGPIVVLLGICCRRPETMQHAMSCFSRLVKAFLGEGSVSPSKLLCGLSLTVLGIDVMLNPEGYVLWPSKEKALVCKAAIKEALGSGRLFAGCAQKLAGRLCWSVQKIFHKVGRAMLRPIYRQKFSRCCSACFGTSACASSCLILCAQVWKH